MYYHIKQGIFITENHKELLAIHNEGTDRILLEGLKLGISINKSKEQLLSMSEKDLMDYLKKEEYYKEKNDIEISVPLVQPEYPEISSVKTQVMILPLSLEDKVQTCGTANVLKEFGKDLNIKCSKNTEYIVFNEKNNKFDIKAARERYIFYKEMEQHQKDMISLKQQFVLHRSFPKDDDNHSGSDDLEDNIIGVQSEKLASSFKAKMKQISSQMSKLLKKMELLVQDKNLSDAYLAVKLNISEWIGQVDRYECNLLHMAVETGNKKLVEALLLSGAPVNSLEGCGLTPLMIAINTNNLDLVKSLVHMLNFTALWPLAYREMFRRNCSVNVKGKHGHNFAIDEYMETFVVKPVKLYGRKQTTIEMLGRICMNIELLEHIKSIYQQSFDTSVGGKSSVPDPTPDWVKVAWFAIHHKWLINAQRKTVNVYPHGKS